jgi:hypothetical protein
MEALIYVTVKYLIYSAWMYVGLYLFRGDKPGFIAAALALGLLRVIAGLILGIASLAMTLPENPVTMFLVVLPGSGVLWLITAWLMNRRLVSRSVYWALAGLTISAAFDLYATTNLSTMSGRWSC